MVFLDDNPFERNIVRENIKGITVPELPEDPGEYLEYLYSLNLFETASYSNADKDRTKQYQVEAKRVSLSKTFTNEADFLKSLNMVSTVSGFTKFNTPRVAQLSQRSNQFNLRTVRYTEADITALAENPDVTIVEACHDYVLEVAKPGVRYADVHFAVCHLMTERLKELGLMKGDTEEAVRAGAHAMFLPHGLGHMMGMDVHDMEGLGQIYVGFDEETRPNLEQFGTNCLRMGRKLEEGFVVTDEPGIYFIPALIDEWKASGHCAEFLNFDKLETYKDFGGIRIEDDLLITRDGCRFLGTKRIPYHPKDLEVTMYVTSGEGVLQ